MKKFNTIIAFTIVCIVMSISSNAQDITTLQLQGLYAGTNLHPGIRLDKKLNIAIGDIAVSLGTGGKPFDQFISQNSNGTYYADRDKLGYLTKQNQDLFYNNRINTVGLSILLKDFHLMIGHTIRTKFDAQYSTDLLELATRGNAEYIGKTLNLGPNINLINYHEINLGAQKSWGGLTIGARANILFGNAAVYTEKSKLDLTTRDEYYQLDLDTDFLMHSSSVIDYNSIDSIDTNLDLNSAKNLFKNNSGFGLDLGASYKIGDKISLSAGITDIGKITWDTNAKSYSSNGKYSYEGIDIIPLIEDDSTKYDLEDTLKNLLKIKEIGGNFSTTLSANYILSGSFKLSDKWTFHGLIVSNGGFKLRRNQLSLAAVRTISIVDLGLQYMMSDAGDFDNLGITVRVNAGPVKIYGGFESIFAVGNPFSSNYASGRIGLACQF